MQKVYNLSSCPRTDHWARPWHMSTISLGSRKDCTEVFLSTTSAASPPRLWPLPPMSSWSRSSTWTDRSVFYTSNVWACVIKQMDFSTSFMERLPRFVLNNVGITFSLSWLQATEKSVKAEKGSCFLFFFIPFYFLWLRRRFAHSTLLDSEQVPHPCLKGCSRAVGYLFSNTK